MDSFHKFTKKGNGKKAMIAFHGFNNDAEDLDDWLEDLPNYTVYVIDWDDKATDSESGLECPVADPDKWVAQFQQFLTENKIERFEILGFSLGARLAIEAAAANSEAVDRLWLLAPLGVITNTWYFLGTWYPTRQLFRFFVKHPSRLAKFASFCKRMKIISEGRYRWQKYYSIKEPSALQKVYRSWQFCRKFSNNSDTWAKLSKVPLMLVAGTDDFVFTRDDFQSASNELNLRGLTVESLLLECGHNRLTGELADWLVDRPDLEEIVEEESSAVTISLATEQEIQLKEEQMTTSTPVRGTASSEREPELFRPSQANSLSNSNIRKMTTKPWR
ncbi:MAG: alpha/beta hydrolase [Cytophagales bacterium]|nr:MAG: alpha/beta hydrolase [Cytophagales bacterium]TAF61950.1 MAG: alpha/beta hydrolase [Cytophagales bacterium]